MHIFDDKNRFQPLYGAVEVIKSGTFLIYNQHQNLFLYDSLKRSFLCTIRLYQQSLSTEGIQLAAFPVYIDLNKTFCDDFDD